MLLDEWVSRFNKNREILLNFIEMYHPALSRAKIKNITAPNAEAARQSVVSSMDKTVPDISFLDKDITEQEVNRCYSLLNSSWFGVPESTNCWQIPGFKEAVNLLEDPPDEPI